MTPSTLTASPAAAAAVVPAAAAVSGQDWQAACEKRTPAEVAAAALADGAAERSALLPAGLLPAAALFASRDANKGVLTAVHVRGLADGSAVVLEATNGHIACRFTVPTRPDGGRSDLWHAPEAGLLLPAAVVAKRQPRAFYVAVRPDRLDVLGGKASKTAVFPPTAFAASLPRWDGEPLAGEYPVLANVWPDVDSLPCVPGGPVCFQAAYLETIGKAAQMIGGDQFGRCNLSLRTGTPITPATWELHGGPTVWGCDDGRAEFLVMPVQVRR